MRRQTVSQKCTPSVAFLGFDWQGVNSMYNCILLQFCQSFHWMISFPRDSLLMRHMVWVIPHRSDVRRNFLRMKYSNPNSSTERNNVSLCIFQNVSIQMVFVAGKFRTVDPDVLVYVFWMLSREFHLDLKQLNHPDRASWKGHRSFVQASNK